MLKLILDAVLLLGYRWTLLLPLPGALCLYVLQPDVEPLLLPVRAVLLGMDCYWSYATKFQSSTPCLNVHLLVLLASISFFIYFFSILCSGWLQFLVS